MIKLPIHWLSMHIKLLLLSLLCVSTLFAKAPQDVEVLAKTVTKDGDVAHAVGNVVLYSPQYLITADEAYYNYVTGDLELFGNITLREGVSYASRSGHTKLNLKSNKGTSDPLFFFDESTKVWLKCDNAVLNPESYITQKSIVSSCNTQDPDWKIAFTSGEFNKESKWLHVYNPVFYADDIPVLYLPYFAFSTDRTRRTGLLRPELGFSGSEGFYYMQPIYFAPDVNWDLELRPQIRTSRGEGLHGTFRFVDSQYSHGEITTGYFKEQSRYASDENLKHNSHYGVHAQYDRSALFSPTYNQIEDGLWLDINYLNDIDYYNTLDSESRAYDKLAISKLNYYVKHDQDYFGLYAKYYIDTSKSSNADTLQELPTLQYHHFLSPILFDNLLYSADYKAHDYTRQEGTTALQHEARAPLTFYYSTLNDYLHLSASENIYMTHVSYGSEDEGGYGQYFSNYHQFSAYTDLSKAYDNFFHTMNFGMDYIVPSYHKKEGSWYTFKDAITNEDLIPLDEEEKSVAFKFKQFFYDMDGEKKISHSIKQVYYSSRTYKYGDLENDIKYYVTNDFYIGDITNYSNEYSKFSRNQISINYKEPTYKVSLRHTYIDKSYEGNFNNTQDGRIMINPNDYSYVTLYAETTRWENMTLFSAINYDVQNDTFKSWSLGVKKVKKCWDYSLVYKDSTLPKLTSSTTSATSSANRKGIMLVFNLYPMGSVGYDFSQETNQK